MPRKTRGGVHHAFLQTTPAKGKDLKEEKRKARARISPMSSGKTDSVVLKI